MKLVLVQPQLGQEPDRTNLDVVTALLDPFAPEIGEDDLVLLPEHVDPRLDPEAYESSVAELARRLRCHVVGGSQHAAVGDRRINRGVALAPDGTKIAEYEKVRPYADERALVEPGTTLGQFSIGGRRVMVLICADFWFSDLIYQAREAPSLILVPALSVTRKPSPDYSRALWRHLAIARAYEFAAFVGISDWAHPSRLQKWSTSGVGGLADPSGVDPDGFFTPIGERGVHICELDFAALDHFRADRSARGFFYKPL